jgi:hypothetical protein
MSLHDECILWTKAKDSGGYGVGWYNNRWMRAHRIAYIQSVGPIPPTMCVMHLCDKRDCVNPAHLALGTSSMNSKDMVSKNRQAKGETSGKNKLTEEQVLSIRTDPRTSSVLSKEYGVSRTTIKDIKKKKIWRHI